MKKNFLLSLLGLSVLLAVSSCKDKNEEAIPLTKSQLLSGATWRLTGVSVSQLGVTIDLFQQLSSCDKDNLTLYKTGGAFEVNEGATKCSSTDPQIVESGTWALTTNETKLSTTSGGFTDVYDILELTATTLKVKQTDQSGTTTITYSK